MLKRLLLSLLLFTAVLNATTPTQENVAKLYVAIFDRAPDSKGLDFWIKYSGLDLEGIAQSFFEQEETQLKYPPGTSAAEFVTSVYANLFNRPPDAAGLAYWAKELDSGNIPRSLFVLAVINGAQGTDDTILKNKTAVGLAFAKAGLDDADDAKCVIAGITAEWATVTEGMEKVKGLLEGIPCVIEGIPQDYKGVRITGQTESYDQDGNEVTDGSIKDDGYYQTGVTSSYTRDKVKEVVIDNVTGLMWQDDSAAATVEQRQDDALTYCSRDVSTGGYRDWRLPTRRELAGIINYSRYDPAISSVFRNTASYRYGPSYYWCSTPYAQLGSYSFFWLVDFDDGDQTHDALNYNYNVRCVRAGQ